MSFCLDRFKLSLSGLLLLFLTAFSTSAHVSQSIQPVQADTTVVADNQCAYQTSLTLYLHFADAASRERQNDLLPLWQEGIDRYWQSSLTFGDAVCSHSTSVKLMVLENDTSCQNERGKIHCVDVVHEALNRRGKVGDLSLMKQGQSGFSYGEWTTAINPMQAAHLIGHALGLDEEYREEDANRDQVVEYVNQRPEYVAPFSLMAKPFPSNEQVAIFQSHIQSLMDLGGITCPSSCACGNSVVDLQFGELCDYAALPSGCKETELCNTSCRCELRPPVCGDSIINGGEQCDFAAVISGCPANLTCQDDCTCEVPVAPVAPDTPTILPPGSTPVTPTRPVNGNGICEPGENCTNALYDCQQTLKCAVCGNNICENNESFSCRRDCPQSQE